MNDIEVVSNEVSISAKHIPTDTILEYEHMTNLITLDSSVDYSIFVKLFKALKREKNRAAFSEPELD